MFMVKYLELVALHWTVYNCFSVSMWAAAVLWMDVFSYWMDGMTDGGYWSDFKTKTVLLSWVGICVVGAKFAKTTTMTASQNQHKTMMEMCNRCFHLLVVFLLLHWLLLVILRVFLKIQYVLQYFDVTDIHVSTKIIIVLNWAVNLFTVIIPGLKMLEIIWW